MISNFRKFGNLLENDAKAGKTKQFVILCHDHRDAQQCIQMAKGDQAKVTVLWPNTGSTDSESLDCPSVPLPVISQSGRLVTRNLFKWSFMSGKVPEQIRVVVPTGKRPINKTFEQRNLNTIVFRVIVDFVSVLPILGKNESDSGGLGSSMD